MVASLYFARNFEIVFSRASILPSATLSAPPPDRIQNFAFFCGKFYLLVYQGVIFPFRFRYGIFGLFPIAGFFNYNAFTLYAVTVLICSLLRYIRFRVASNSCWAFNTSLYFSTANSCTANALARSKQASINFDLLATNKSSASLTVLMENPKSSKRSLLSSINLFLAAISLPSRFHAVESSVIAVTGSAAASTTLLLNSSCAFFASRFLDMNLKLRLSQR